MSFLYNTNGHVFLTHISLNFLSEYSVEYKYECDKLVLLSFCVTYFVDRKFIVMLPLHNMCCVFLIVMYAVIYYFF